ncbi:MAG: Fic family protein [Proteobacteria bacterium]|nr:Fic family protein [Pseudomonadota bacterium]
MTDIESVSRIEPARLESIPESIADMIADISAQGALLGRALHPTTAANLAALIRIMNSYYSNLIEGHDTRPKDIERALANELDPDEQRRNLQLEAKAHVRVQAEIDLMAAEDRLPEPASIDFIRWLHREFYRDAPEDMLRIRTAEVEFLMEPGEWRSLPEHDNAVGRHIPPSSHRVQDFMAYFEDCYRVSGRGNAAQIMAMATAHHRFNYIHPFPDGNGRVSRLMSQAMAHHAGIGAHGLWSISRGLARGLESRGDYKRWMDAADAPRQGDMDGRGNLSLSALTGFTEWFLQVTLDQITFMNGLFELNTLDRRLAAYVARHDSLKPEATLLLQEALIRGAFERGEAPRITGQTERTARRVLNDVTEIGLLGSETPKGPVSLRFPVDALETLFPLLYSAS